MALPHPRAAVVGLAGPALTAEEVGLFREAPPAGLILFARNVVDPCQLRCLTEAARDLLGPALPILVDQEGGRVARLRPPHWPEFPPAAAFEALPEEAARANAALLGLTCHEAGPDVVCAPVLDLRLAGAHQVIGDRAFAAEPAEVARLGGAWIAGLQEAGCIPVIKHLPGHGRAAVDSHLDLPRVAASRAELEADLAPFAALADTGAWAMTAHILYEALDAERPATLSPEVIGGIIRRAIGFRGVLVSDDLAMRALRGAPGELARRSIAAGCDLVLHCTGALAETAAVLRATPPLSGAASRRMEEARERAEAARLPRLDRALLAVRRDTYLAAAA